MAVEIAYTTRLRDFKARHLRTQWLVERIPSYEFMTHQPASPNDDGWDPDDYITTTVTIWHDDAERIATEFWFKFP